MRRRRVLRAHKSEVYEGHPWPNLYGRKRIRKSFGRIPEVTQHAEPHRGAAELLRTSCRWTSRPSAARWGLEEVFHSVFPDQDFSDRAVLDFVHYELEQPKYDVEECQQRGMTYAAPLKVTLRLIVFDVDEETGSGRPRHQGAGRLHGRHARS